MGSLKKGFFAFFTAITLIKTQIFVEKHNVGGKNIRLDHKILFIGVLIFN
jgi:hypothetical protein